MGIRPSFNTALMVVAAICLSGAHPAHSQKPSEIDIPIAVGLGNAVVPVVGVRGGYAWHPPQLVIVSVPFAHGALKPETPLTVYDTRDQALPTERTILSTWPDGSVRWAQLRFDSHLGTSKWTLEDYGLRHDGIHTELPWDYRVRIGTPAPAPAVAVNVEQNGRVIVVDTGRLTVRIDPDKAGFGFSQVHVEGIEKPVAGPVQIHVRYADGTSFTSEGVAASEVRIEEAGPLRAVVYLRSRLGEVYELQTRLFFHADEPAVRAEHTLAGLGDREMDNIQRIHIAYDTGLVQPFNFRAPGSAMEYAGLIEDRHAIVLRQQGPRTLPLPARDFEYQLVERWHNHTRVLGRGGRTDGWLRCSDGKLDIGMAIRRFSEKAPKALRVGGDGECEIDLWAEGEPLPFSRARAITHQVLYSFLPTPEPPETDKHYKPYHHETKRDLPYRAYVRPVVPVVDVEYMCRTQAFGPFVSAATSKLQDYEAMMGQNFENFHRRWQDRATSYGMMHFGDYISPWPGDNGENPDRAHWRDHEWEFTTALFTRYLRTGDPRVFELGVAAYRHYMDVDVHYTKHFNFYHSYGNKGDMHGKYHGPEIGHVVLTGLIDAYLFTGDRRALEVARRLCDYVVDEFDEGEEAIKRLLGRQMRSIPWRTLGLIRLHEITGERKYIEAAGKAIDVLRQHTEIWQRKGGTWGVGLLGKAIEEYHRATGDPSARELFLHNADWALDSYYIPELRTFGQRPGKPKFGYGPERVESGNALMTIGSTFGYAYELTGDAYYLDVAYQLFHEGMRVAPELIPRDRAPANRRGYYAGATRSDGKWLSSANFYSNRLPTAFRNLNEADMDRIRKAQPQRRPMPGR